VLAAFTVAYGVAEGVPKGVAEGGGGKAACDGGTAGDGIAGWAGI
jgi:hypothetical protein